MKTFKLELFALALTLGFASCELEEKIEKATDVAGGIEALQEYAVVNKHYQDASNGGDAATLEAEAMVIGSPLYLKSARETGPVITINSFDINSGAKNITVDFGDGIVGKDGVTRKGMLNIVSTGRLKSVNSEHTTTFINYYQNGNKIEGKHLAKNVGVVEGKGHQFAVTITDGKVTTPEDKVILFSQSTTRTWIAGDATPFDIWDDQYELDGTQYGTSSKGVKYTIQITDPLHFVMYPREVRSGMMEVNIEGLQTITLNYATGKGTIGEYEFDFNK